MKEHQPRDQGWRRIRLPGGGYAHFNPNIDPSIQARMSPETKTFMQVGPLELVKRDIQNFLYNLECTLRGGIMHRPPPGSK